MRRKPFPIVMILLLPLMASCSRESNGIDVDALPTSAPTSITLDIGKERAAVLSDVHP